MKKQSIIKDYNTKISKINEELEKQKGFYEVYKFLPILFFILLLIFSFILFIVSIYNVILLDGNILISFAILFGGIISAFLVKIYLSVLISASITKIEYIRKLAIDSELKLRLDNLNEDLEVVVIENTENDQTVKTSEENKEQSEKE